MPSTRRAEGVLADRVRATWRTVSVTLAILFSFCSPLLTPTGISSPIATENNIIVPLYRFLKLTVPLHGRGGEGSFSSSVPYARTRTRSDFSALMPILDPSMDVDACLHFQVSMAPAIKSMAEAFGCSRAKLTGLGPLWWLWPLWWL